MANQIAPDAPDEGYVNEMGLAFNVPAVEAVFGAPTDEQMLNEHRRLVIIDWAQTVSGYTLLGPAEHLAAIRRYHTIMATVDFGQNNNHDHNQNPNQLAKINAENARIMNKMNNLSLPHVPFVPVVKEIPGHPFPQAPAVHNVVYNNNNYDVNSSPPDNLIPADFHALYAVSTGAVGLARDRLRAIYWFYNDPRLVIGENATRVQCGLAVGALNEFLMH
ncbi:hypothetical protein ACP275_05G058700 [Erythranthe tilingii]